MNTFEAWATGRPIYSRLPGMQGAYNENPVADWLTDFWDQILIESKAKVDLISAKQLNPLDCDAEWLDYLAQLFGFTGEYWDVSWDVAGKRLLLSNAYQGVNIWGNKGSAAVLTFVLAALGVQNKVVVSGDFLVNISEVGDPIGENPWDYTIYLPERLRGKSEAQLAEKMNRLYGPCWCESRVMFDDSEFFTTLFLVGDGEILATEDDEVIQA
jgi:Phage tail protein (Tail_P2_I)